MVLLVFPVVFLAPLERVLCPVRLLADRDRRVHVPEKHHNDGDVVAGAGIPSRCHQFMCYHAAVTIILLQMVSHHFDCLIGVDCVIEAVTGQNEVVFRAIQHRGGRVCVPTDVWLVLSISCGRTAQKHDCGFAATASSSPLLTQCGANDSYPKLKQLFGNYSLRL